MNTKHLGMLGLAVVGGFLLSIGVAGVAVHTLVGRQPDGSVMLPNGQTITFAGVQIEVNDRPLGIAVTPDGAQAAVATASNFAPRALQFIDLSTAWRRRLPSATASSAWRSALTATRSMSAAAPTTT